MPELLCRVACSHIRPRTFGEYKLENRDSGWWSVLFGKPQAGRRSSLQCRDQGHLLFEQRQLLQNRCLRAKKMICQIFYGSIDESTQ